MIDTEKIARALSRAGQVRIAVFGDFCLDKYLYIDPRRDEISVETGLTAYMVHEKKYYAGAAGTIVNNLRSLEAWVYCIGLRGDDGEGWELENCLCAIGANTGGMVKSNQICTSTYTKPMRAQPDGSYRELNRLDFRNFSEAPRSLQKQLLTKMDAILHQVDAVILLDQFVQRNLGAITDHVREELCRMAQNHPEVIFYADSRGFLQEFRNMIVKCNNFELLPDGDPEDTEAFCRRGRELSRRQAFPTFVTRGSRGMLVLTEGEAVPVPAFRVEGPIDIVGAGDASTAGIVLGLALGLTPEEAALLGCAVSSITIQQLGTTGTATRAQVAARLAEYAGGTV